LSKLVKAGSSTWSPTFSPLMDNSYKPIPEFKSEVGRTERSAPKTYSEAAPYLRKDFLTEKQIVKARAYISGMGLYELSINGEKVGDHVLDPAFTNFDKRVHYITYDVTSQLQNGKNTLGVLLGNGWYNMDSRAVWGFNKAPWKDRPTCLLQLEIEHEDGSVQKILSDESWKAAPSPTVYNDIRQGEKYDATREIPGWNKPSLDDTSWAPVRVKQGPLGQLKAQMIPANKVMREIIPVSVNSPEPGVYLVDMGQNMAGWIQLKVEGDSGEVVKMKFKEINKNLIWTDEGFGNTIAFNTGGKVFFIVSTTYWKLAKEW